MASAVVKLGGVMPPFGSVRDLPMAIRKRIEDPEAAEIFRRTVNSLFPILGHLGDACRAAWRHLEDSGYWRDARTGRYRHWRKLFGR